jgi:hypothetical protein
MPVVALKGDFQDHARGSYKAGIPTAYSGLLVAPCIDQVKPAVMS